MTPFTSVRGILLRFVHRDLVLCSVLSTVSALASTTVMYNPQQVSVGPYPSNLLTVADTSTHTGLRVHLPAGEGSCSPAGHDGVCSSVSLLNTLDGFNVNARTMVCFSGPINPNSIKQGIQIVSADAPYIVTPLNQIVYDGNSHCTYGKPDQILNQDSRYLLIVTTSLKDVAGNSVSDGGGYAACLSSTAGYCKALSSAVRAVPAGGIVSASLFTTLSATSFLESVHDAVESLPGVGQVLPAGNPSVFQLSGVQSLTWLPDQSGLPPQSIPLSALSGVGSVAFGLIMSPNYLNPSGAAAGTISGTSTTPVPLPGLPTGLEPVSFHVFLPSGVAPPGGWPVVIYGHGLSDNQFGAPTYFASTMAQWGFATLAMEITGHGFGPNSVVTVTGTNGKTSVVATPGRGIQLAPPAPIGPQDGCIVPGPIAIRDCGRQTAVDLFALIKAIRNTNGLGLGLNDDRIYYVGQSFGSIYGSLFMAVEPSVHAAVLNVGGGTFTDIARLAITGRPLGGAFLASLGLLNVNPGDPNSAPPEAYFESCTSLCFNDNYPFRDRPPVLNDIPGALEIQAAFEASEWLGAIGDPLAYAPHFKTLPLSGVSPKATLFQFGLGDLEVPNPTESALIRAANGQDTSWYFRFDRAAAADPALLPLTAPGVPYPILPHRILSNPTIFSTPGETPISLAEQGQVAVYFALNGLDLLDPNFLLPFPQIFQGLFERPAVLPEALQFQQIQP